jgi:hypothetical protein
MMMMMMMMMKLVPRSGSYRIVSLSPLRLVSAFSFPITSKYEILRI